MKIFITGGTGFIGSTITRTLANSGHDLTILTRAIPSGSILPTGVRFLIGDSTKEGTWQKDVAEHEVVINLAGASIFRRWNARNKAVIRESRVLTTRHVVEALASFKGRDSQLLNASGIGIYGACGDEEITENSPPGDNFIAQVAVQWEREALAAERCGTRVVLCRFSQVMGRGGGPLNKLVRASQFHMATKWGNGQQWVSWIHEDDVANIILFLLKNNDITGPLNITSPNPIRNTELAAVVARTFGKRVLIPGVPAPILKSLMGDFTEELLHGQRAVPQKLLSNNLLFQYPTILEALKDLSTGRL
jgi:uncharacterized protein (TIGR01777 family)